jgi:hypothetical protein
MKEIIRDKNNTFFYNREKYNTTPKLGINILFYIYNTTPIFDISFYI